MLPTLRQE